MNIYIFMQIFTSIAALTYLIYLLIGWRTSTSTYDAYWMYFTGAAQTSFFTLLPVAILGLGLDRCFFMLFPVKYSKEKNRYLVVLTFLVMIFLITYSYIFRIIPAYPSKAQTSCLAFGCITTPHGSEIYTIIRYSTSSLILVVSGFLIFLVKYKLQILFAKDKVQKVNKLVLSTLTTTFIFDFLPHLASFVFNTILGMNLALYLGPYSTVISSIESGLCALLYRKVFKLTLPRKSIVTSIILPSNPAKGPRTVG